MDDITYLLVLTLMPVIILVILVWKKQWVLLFGISIMAAFAGILEINEITDMVAGRFYWCSFSYTETEEIICLQHHSIILERAAIKFLSAIFILILAIFAWLREKADKNEEV